MKIISIVIMPTFMSIETSGDFGDEWIERNIQPSGPDASTEQYSVFERRADGDLDWVADCAAADMADALAQIRADILHVEIETPTWRKA